jgi:hypothetical protein
MHTWRESAWLPGKSQAHALAYTLGAGIFQATSEHHDSAA